MMLHSAGKIAMGGASLKARGGNPLRFNGLALSKALNPVETPKTDIAKLTDQVEKVSHKVDEIAAFQGDTLYVFAALEKVLEKMQEKQDSMLKLLTQHNPTTATQSKALGSRLSMKA